MTAPIWLMDVDGVLNTFTYPDPLVHGDYQTFKSGNGFTITWSPSLLKRITDHHHNDVIDVRWLTTWQSGANELLRETFGFNEDLVVEGGDCDMPYWGTWWKLSIAKNAVAEYDRVIWTDDDIRHDSEAPKFIKDTSSLKLITVSPVTCLTHAHLDRIEEWISL